MPNNPTADHAPECPCRLCWLAKNDPRYQELWGLQVTAPPRPIPDPASSAAPSTHLPQKPCKHLGGANGEAVECQSCAGRVMVKLMDCEVYGACTVHKPVPSHPCCTTCATHSERQPQDVIVNPPRIAQDGRSTINPIGPTLRWTYGITTVPARKDTYLKATMVSLALGGFPKPRLFVDGTNPQIEGAYRDEFPSSECTFRTPKLGCWGNCYASLLELYLRDPMADRYALFQDDMVCVKNLRRYLELIPYPNGGRAYLNLFTFRENEDVIQGKQVGFHEACELDTSRGGGMYHGKRQQAGRGALALVFTRDALQVVLSSTHTVRKCTGAGDRGWRFSDGGIVEAMNQGNYWEYIHSPSLVQHTGSVSSIGNNGRGKALSFPGEEVDALTLLPSSITSRAPNVQLIKRSKKV